MQEINPNNNIYVIQVAPSGVGGIQTYSNILEKKLQIEGVLTDKLETYTLDVTSSIMLVEILKKIKQIILNLIRLSILIRNHKRYKTQIIHCHVGSGVSFWENSLYALLGHLLNVPVIFHIHSSLLHLEYLHSSYLTRIVRKYILGKISTQLIVLSRYWKKQLLQIDGLHPEKALVVYNFVDTEQFKEYNKFKCRKLLRLPLNKKILISIGRLEKEKGYKYLIDAINMTTQIKKDILCIIIGNGTLKKHLETYTQEVGLNDYIMFVGLKPLEEIPLWLNAADIFVLPSVREAFPMVMLEALASGIPFIGSKVGAIPEVISSDKYGFLVEPANPKDLSEKIVAALEKKWNRKKIRKYAGQFTWDKSANKILEIYRRFVDERK